MENDKWNLRNLPPPGHKDVPDFGFLLFDIARAEKERLGKNKDMLRNYGLYRGKQNQQTSARKGYRGGSIEDMMPINLLFANIERTVSSITARNPTGEVVDLDGINDGAEQVVTTKLVKWWKDTDQQQKTRQTARTMEIYGITSEKPYWDKRQDQPDIVITDPFQFFPAPGYYDNLSEEAPYICYAYLDFISKIEDEFKVTGIAKEDAYDLMGMSREEFKPTSGGGQNRTIGNYADAVTVIPGGKGSFSDKAVDRCLVIEIWVRDDRETSTSVKVPLLDPFTGQSELDENGFPVIEVITTTGKATRDGIRKITIAKAKDPDKDAKSGYMVLNDSPNPNLNPNLQIDLAANTYPWGRLPVYHANSYSDMITIWGFPAADQIGDLIVKINLMMRKLISYVLNVMTPPLIVQQHCGITREMIESSINRSGRLILMPTTPNARIEFMTIPNLPETFFRVLDLIVGFFDRIYQIEDADRGVAPSGIVAASAIVALQERNREVMQTKTSAIDNIAEQRSRWAIGLWQNFGTTIEYVNVAGESRPFSGADYAGRKFSYVIESGSTTPKTSLQLQEMAVNLYKMGAIGQRGLLEAVNWPGWKDEIERTAETQLDQALNILIAAGLPKEAAIMLRNALMQPGQGPGDVQKSQEEPVTATPSSESTPRPGVPKEMQE